MYWIFPPKAKAYMKSPGEGKNPYLSKVVITSLIITKMSLKIFIVIILAIKILTEYFLKI